MKRSDAVKAISNVLLMESPTAMTEEESFELAEKVLSKAEELGMKPYGYIENSEFIGSYIEKEWMPE